MSRALGVARRQARAAAAAPAPPPVAEAPVAEEAAAVSEAAAAHLSSLLEGLLAPLEAAEARVETEQLLAQQWRSRRKRISDEMSRKDVELDQLRRRMERLASDTVVR